MGQDCLHLLAQGGNTGSGHSVAQEVQLPRAELALLPIYDQAVVPEPLEEEAKVLHVGLDVSAAYNDIVQVDENERHAAGKAVHHALESVPGVAQPKTHTLIFIKTK